MKRTALVLGATGLVGRHCLQMLLEGDRYSEVRAVSRRMAPIAHVKLNQALVDFDKLEDSAKELQGEDVFCCLGTTLKKAGSAERFVEIDFGYASRACAIAAKNGAKRLFLVSSVGANSASSNLYLKTKGRLEEDLRAHGPVELHIFRPSFLLGDREEPRPMERASIWAARAIGPLLRGPLQRYHPIEARQLARVMVRVAELEPSAGYRTHEGSQLFN